MLCCCVVGCVFMVVLCIMGLFALCVFVVRVVALLVGAFYSYYN